MTERVLAVCFPAGELRADDRDDGGPGIGDIVDGIQHNRNGMGGQTDEGLERRQQDICEDADNAGPDDDLVAGCCLCCVIFCHGLTFFHKRLYEILHTIITLGMTD